ncbi:hypothetical protein N7467_010449 [Penicillium canescens]|nr:hypothetical protein N7467_010449 [Penicillium canescens]
MSVSALPTELVRDICSHLELRDWCAFRVTCKAVYIKSLETFAERCYKSIGFILTRHSLCQLEELAAHDIFRTRVQELCITPSLFEGYYEMDLDSFRDATGSYKSKRSADMIKAEYIAYQGLVAEHLSIVESDTLSNVLKKYCNTALMNFSGVNWSITISGASVGAQQDASLDLIPSRWGAENPYTTETRAKDHAVAFSALLEAVVSCKRRIKKLDTCNDEHCALPPSDPVSALVPRTIGIFTSLTSICETQLDDSVFRSLVDLPIMVAPSLKDLNGALAPQYFDNLSQRINFTSIREIHLYWTKITFDTLKAFLRTARPTLRVLSLESVNLRGALPPTDKDTGHERDLRDCQEMIKESNSA